MGSMGVGCVCWGTDLSSLKAKEQVPLCECYCGCQDHYNSSQGLSPDIQQSIVSKLAGYPPKAQALFPA